MKTTTIGERIRDLRKKRDLTQEKLADFLGVSYQAVSKWECNLTSPDLGLIGPLTKLLGVTSDELLGLTEEECDERKAFFDEAMARFHDDELDVYAQNAEAAVREFPRRRLSFIFPPGNSSARGWPGADSPSGCGCWGKSAPESSPHRAAFSGPASWPWSH